MRVQDPVGQRETRAGTRGGRQQDDEHREDREGGQESAHHPDRGEHAELLQARHRAERKGEEARRARQGGDQARNSELARGENERVGVRLLPVSMVEVARQEVHRVGHADHDDERGKHRADRRDRDTEVPHQAEREQRGDPHRDDGRHRHHQAAEDPGEGQEHRSEEQRHDQAQIRPRVAPGELGADRWADDVYGRARRCLETGGDRKKRINGPFTVLLTPLSVGLQLSLK
jgi:hypothetical protein